MKKFYIALMFLFATTCTAIQSENFFDISFLIPIDGLEIKTSKSSYMFFVEKQRVFIKGSTDSDNGWYHLVEGSSPSKDIVAYQLDGSGLYKDLYIAILLKTENQQTKVSVSIQSTRDFAINAVNSSTSVLTTGETRLSPAMYVLYSIPTWIQISRAGIINPNADITYVNFQNTGNEIIGAGRENALLNVTNVDNITTDLTVYPPISLTFQTNVSSTIAIYSFADGRENVLLGVILDIEHSSPRINILTNNIGSANAEGTPIIRFAQELIANTFWEFVSLESVQSSDGSLKPLQDKTWVRISSENKYNPISTEFWGFDSGGNTAWLERSEPGKTKIEEYLLELTDTQGIYKLLNNSTAPLIPHKYLDKYIAIESTEDTLGRIFIGDSIQNVQTMINNNTDGFIIQSLEAPLTPLSMAVSGQSSINDVLWGNVGGRNIGRSGFVAYESSGRIYVVGGQTNSFQLLSSQPQLPGASLELIPVYNEIFYLDNITYADFNLINFNLVPRSLDFSAIASGGNVSFQQAVGAVARGVQGGSDRLITLGFGADGANRLSDINLTTINNPDATGNINELPTSFNDRYHGSFLTHKDYAYTFGGILAPGSLQASGPTKNFGTYQQDIYRSSLHISFNTWEQIIPNTPIWEPRAHTKVFSIDNDIILVGGMVQETPLGESTPINDVWISHDDGITWQEINDGTDPNNSPPKQANNRQGPLAGTSYGKLLFIVDITGEIYHSIDRGRTWKQEGSFTDGALPLGNLFGAQLIAYEGYLFLLGGQTSTDNPIDFNNDSAMSKKMYRVKFDFF